MIFLYIIISYDKFYDFYQKIESNQPYKEFIYFIMKKNQVIEKIFINTLVTTTIIETKDKNIIIKITNQCTYFSNFLLIIDLYTKNIQLNHEIQDFSQKNYLVSYEDDINSIIELYNSIKCKIQDFTVNEQIWENYINVYKNQKKIKNLILLNPFFIDKTKLIDSLNESLFAFYVTAIAVLPPSHISPYPFRSPR